MRLMILEDDPLVSEYITNVVQDDGHEVIGSIIDAEAAVDLAAATNPDLLIADIDLGKGGSGISAAVSIRESIGIKTLFVTGYTDAVTRDRAQHAWPLGFIKKPFNAEELIRVLRSAIGVLPLR